MAHDTSPLLPALAGRCIIATLTDAGMEARNEMAAALSLAPAGLISRP